MWFIWKSWNNLYGTNNHLIDPSARHFSKRKEPLALILNDAIARFTEDRLLKGLSPSSVHEYDTQLKVFARWLSNLNVADTQNIDDDMPRAYLCHRRQKVSQSTLCHDRAIIHLFIRFLYQVRQCGCSPASVPSVSAPNEDDLRRVHLNENQCIKLFAHLRQEWRDHNTEPLAGYLAIRNLSVAGLLFGVGLRISEVASAKMRDIDLYKRELYIPKSKTNRPGLCVVPGSTIAILRLYLHVRRGIGLKSGPNSPLISGLNGKHYARSTLVRPLQKAAQACKIEFTSHAGRRFCITSLAEVSVFAAQEQARHQRVETTRKYVRPRIQHLHTVVRDNDPLKQAI